MNEDMLRYCYEFDKQEHHNNAAKNLIVEAAARSGLLASITELLALKKGIGMYDELLGTLTVAFKEAFPSFSKAQQ